jgi:hypothetical protein
MEPIKTPVEGDGLVIEHLQLCPRCYLVTWTDQYGFHTQQGIPVPAMMPNKQQIFVN